MPEQQENKDKADLSKVFKETDAVLEHYFHLDINTRFKVLNEYFSEGYLPIWYFYSNSPSTIANHIYMLTHHLDSNSDTLVLSGSNNLSRTYFVNIGRDHPGRLHEIVQRNLPLGINSLNASGSKSGVNIVTIELEGSASSSSSPAQERGDQNALIEVLQKYGAKHKFKSTDEFITTLSSSYIHEERMLEHVAGRAQRHLRYFEALSQEKTFFSETIITDQAELRLSLAGRNAQPQFLLECLDVFRKLKINIDRVYYDIFSGTNKVEVLSFYLYGEKKDAVPLCAELRKSLEPLCSNEKQKSGSALERKVEALIRQISSPLSDDELTLALQQLNGLCQDNLKEGEELGNYYLNSVTDFLQAAQKFGLDKSPKLIQMLLGFEQFERFFVDGRNDKEIRSYPGYRLKHSSVRGPAKGGLRIDPHVNFCEVAALSFMMSWKCARSRILFGGAKGGLMLKPWDFDINGIDYFDTLNSFGRSLFLVSGPFLDVPAGDVGCGPQQIGQMFEGFKTALRDLALLVFGVRANSVLIGDRMITYNAARDTLKSAFDIDYSDRELLRELCSNKDYLELVVAAQITGKPRMGIATRNGATGRGLCYASLAAVANLYKEGKWQATESLSSEDEKLLGCVTAVNTKSILEAGGVEPIDSNQWDKLCSEVFPKLLKDKTMIIQGCGKVGGSIITEMASFGVRLIAVSDAHGAIIGENLDHEKVFNAIFTEGSVIHTKEGISQYIQGATEASSILELECDFLFPAALENAVHEGNAPKIKAKIEVCGSNGANTSKAERILNERGVTVIYDFLANGAGVTASYFEWLRNLNDRFQYEAEQIYAESYDVSVMKSYIMPEFRRRIFEILKQPESQQTTKLWNSILRDIMFSSVNEDYSQSLADGVSMKEAGFLNAQLRVAAASLKKLPAEQAEEIISQIPQTLRQRLDDEFFSHPELQEGMLSS